MRIKIQVLPTGTRSLVGKATALEKAEDLGSSHSECHIFSFVPLRPFFCAALAKRLEGPISTRVCII